MKIQRIACPGQDPAFLDIAGSPQSGFNGLQSAAHPAEVRRSAAAFRKGMLTLQNVTPTPAAKTPDIMDLQAAEKGFVGKDNLLAGVEDEDDLRHRMEDLRQERLALPGLFLWFKQVLSARARSRGGSVITPFRWFIHATSTGKCAVSTCSASSCRSASGWL